MSRVLVLYYSSWGHVETLAEAIAKGAVEAGAFGVAGGQVTKLFEPVEEALDHVAVGVDRGVEDGWATAT